MTSPNPILKVEDVSKSFPGVQALDGVSFDVLAGEVHALVGENGAGKSTLMKILAGIHPPDKGRIIWQGEPVHLRSPAEAQQLGISIIFQEFNLLPDLTVAENLLFNQEPVRWRFIHWGEMHRRARDLLAQLSTTIDPQALAASLSVAQQQIVEIAKALSRDARLVIMDEPTAALNPAEVSQLFNVIRRLKERGCAVIFISHRLDEVMAISDRVTVFKDGRWVGTDATTNLTRDEIVRMMVGRDLKDIFPPRVNVLRNGAEPPLLEAHGLTTSTLRGVSFQLHAGEVLGFAGLEGHGQREVARALFGLERVVRGRVMVAGQLHPIRSPKQAIQAGILFVSDDRKVDGLALRLSVRENVSLPNLGAFSRFGFVRGRAERREVQQVVQALNIRTPTIERETRFLSGGNQQKAVLGKWMMRSPRIMVFVEPTRGVDIGAKVEIYNIIARLAGEGVGIILVSSEILELLGMCHRIVVMRDGAVQTELPAENCTEEIIMRAATGIE